MVREFAEEVSLDLIGAAGDRGRGHRYQDLRHQSVHRAVIAGQQRIGAQQRGMPSVTKCLLKGNGRPIGLFGPFVFALVVTLRS